MVAAWSVDRLGRSLIDLVGILQEFHAKDVDLYLHQQGIDTSTPSGRAMFQMLGVFAEFERAMIRERVMAGLARAKADGTRLGRPATVADDAAKVERSALPAPQARASGPLHASKEWASGRFRALRDRTQALPREQFDSLSRISRHSSAPTRPLAPPDRTGAGGRITPRQNFRALNLLLVVSPQRSPDAGSRSVSGVAWTVVSAITARAASSASCLCVTFAASPKPAEMPASAPRDF